MTALISPEHDNLYHYLRRLAVDGSDEEINAVINLINHLLGGGDYQALTQYERFYGLEFIAEPVFNLIKEKDWVYTRVVELGAGTGWLSRYIASKSGMLPVFTVDKRPWARIDLVANLETEEGVEALFGELRPGDLIVMCEFLHCVDGSDTLLNVLSGWNRLILERVPKDPAHKDSFESQLIRFGAYPYILTTEAEWIGEFAVVMLDKGEM